MLFAILRVVKLAVDLVVDVEVAVSWWTTEIADDATLTVELATLLAID
jgi:hypothetical protein